MFKKWFCKHDFHLLTSYEKDIDPSVGYKRGKVFIIYCPKCKKQIEVLDYEHEAIMKRQEIDRSYRTMNGHKSVSNIEVLESLPKNFKYDWGVETIKAPQVWSKTKGKGVKVMVVDTGVDTKHPDLKYTLGYNPFEKNDNVQDDRGHGSHVAGLIAGKHTGVAPEVELYVTKSLNKDNKGTMASVLDGITLAINMKVDILAMSLGVAHDLPVILQQRIIEAVESGITVVCAVGNSGLPDIEYPAFMDEVIAVGGVDKDLKIAKFSNYGNQLDVVAPAVDILSTYNNGNYARMTGTSMASPLVAGAIALLIAYNRDKGVELKPRDVKEKLKLLGRHHIEYGYGVMDLEKLMD